ncbi:MAG: phosphate ABC transporter permease subunit PstC, partial [Cereibacter changlensis]
MSIGILVLVILALAAAGFFLGRNRALAAAGGDPRKLHSLPAYYGRTVALFASVPALVLMAAWLIVQPELIENRVAGQIAQADIAEGTSRNLLMSDVRRIADALDQVHLRDGVAESDLPALTPEDPRLRTRLSESGITATTAITPSVFTAAQSYRSLTDAAEFWRGIAVLAAALAGFAFAVTRIHVEFRARNVFERFVLVLLIGSSLIAVLTTLGIVLSLLFETIHFFRIYPFQDFFFSTKWNPQFRGGSDLGIWPLLWGTMYVSLIALLVAVPLGLLSAIYLSEYAGPRMRAYAKPAIEVLAGIPTIVYGLFALITVGPLLRDYFAQPLGLGNSSSSVMTAGLVMGVMLIPFVSSLSDDIINAVPQSLRDGSYGLGATQSETIKQVVLPAALPGIVGAILLAASRAIGETMIVVLGAGAAARMDVNPFEAMTTVTVKIVS